MSAPITDLRDLEKKPEELEEKKSRKIKNDLAVFAITFSINTLIVGLTSLVRGEIAIVVVWVFVVPTIGGVVRGYNSKVEKQNFFLYTFIWALLLTLVYVPVFGIFTVGMNYGFNILAGLVTAAVMFLASAIGYAIRKSKYEKIRAYQEQR